jgi:hypothetical protein
MSAALSTLDKASVEAVVGQIEQAFRDVGGA